MMVAMFLEEPPLTPEVRSMFAQEINEHGYVANSTRLWAWRPDVFEAFKQARVITGETMDLSPRAFAVLISATVARNNDAYCALAWGSALAEEAGEGTAVEVLTGVGSGGMSAREASLAAWARRVTADATSTTADDVGLLRDVGFSDRAIFEITAIIAFRIAYSTIRTALGARADQQLASSSPAGVRRAVTFGRPVADAPSRSLIE